MRCAESSCHPAIPATPASPNISAIHLDVSYKSSPLIPVQDAVPNICVLRRPPRASYTRDTKMRCNKDPKTSILTGTATTATVITISVINPIMNMRMHSTNYSKPVVMALRTPEVSRYGDCHYSRLGRADVCNCDIQYGYRRSLC